MLVINSFDLSLNGLNSSVLFKSSLNESEVILELLNQSFDDFLAIRVFCLDGWVRYTWNSVINVTATSFPDILRDACDVCPREVSDKFPCTSRLVRFDGRWIFSPIPTSMLQMRREYDAL